MQSQDALNPYVVYTFDKEATVKTMTVTKSAIAELTDAVIVELFNDIRVNSVGKESNSFNIDSLKNPLSNYKHSSIDTMVNGMIKKLAIKYADTYANPSEDMKTLLGYYRTYFNEYNTIHLDVADNHKDVEFFTDSLRRDVISLLQNKLAALNISTEMEADEIVVEAKNTSEYVNNMEISAWDMTSPLIKVLVNTLPALEYTEIPNPNYMPNIPYSKPTINVLTYSLSSSGLPKLANGSEIFNALLDLVKDAPSNDITPGEYESKPFITYMEDRLRAVTDVKPSVTRSKSYPKALLSAKVMFNHNIEGKEYGGYFSFNNLVKNDAYIGEMKSNIYAASTFAQTFHRTQVDMHKTLLHTDGFQSTSAISDFTDINVKREWNSNLMTTDFASISDQAVRDRNEKIIRLNNLAISLSNGDDLVKLHLSNSSTGLMHEYNMTFELLELLGINLTTYNNKYGLRDIEDNIGYAYFQISSLGQMQTLVASKQEKAVKGFKFLAKDMQEFAGFIKEKVKNGIPTGESDLTSLAAILRNAGYPVNARDIFKMLDTLDTMKKNDPEKYNSLFIPIKKTKYNEAAYRDSVERSDLATRALNAKLVLDRLALTENDLRIQTKTIMGKNSNNDKIYCSNLNFEMTVMANSINSAFKGVDDDSVVGRDNSEERARIGGAAHYSIMHLATGTSPGKAELLRYYLSKNNPHLGAEYARNSIIFQRDDRGNFYTRRIAIGYNIGATDVTSEEGVTIGKMTHQDKFALDVHNVINNNIYTFFRAADRTSETTFAITEANKAIKLLDNNSPESSLHAREINQKEIDTYINVINSLGTNDIIDGTTKDQLAKAKKAKAFIPKDFKVVFDRMLYYLEDEIMEAIRFRVSKNFGDKVVSFYAKKMESNKLKFFDSYVDHKLIDAVIEYGVRYHKYAFDEVAARDIELTDNKTRMRYSLDLTRGSVRDILNANQELFDAMIRNEAKRRAEITLRKGLEEGYIHKSTLKDVAKDSSTGTTNNMKDVYKILGFSYNSKKEFSYEDMVKLLAYFNMSQGVAYIEYTKLFTGDIVYYKDPNDTFKRFKMVNAGKKTSLISDKEVTALNNSNFITFTHPNGTVTPIYATGDNANPTLLRMLGAYYNDVNELYNDLMEYQSAVRRRNELQEGEQLTQEDQDIIDSFLFSRDLTPELESQIVSLATKGISKVDIGVGYNPNLWSKQYSSMILGDHEITDGVINDYLGDYDIYNTLKVELLDSSRPLSIDNLVISFAKPNGGEKISLTFEQLGIAEQAFIRSYIERDKYTNLDTLSTKMKSNAGAFVNLNVTDGEAYVTLPAFKKILHLNGQWNDDLDNIYIKAITNQPLTSKEIYAFASAGSFEGEIVKQKTHGAGFVRTVKYTSNLLLHPETRALILNHLGLSEQDVTIEGNELLVDYADAVLDGASVPPVVMKHSLTPLLPYVIKNRALERLARFMIANNIDLANRDSAVKYGAFKTPNIITDSNGEKAVALKYAIFDEHKVRQRKPLGFENNFITFTVNANNFGSQVEIAPHRKGKVTPGTQFRKLILVDMYDNGIPIDFMKDYDLTTRLNNWESLLASLTADNGEVNVEEMMNYSPLFVKDYAYMKNTEALMEKALVELKNRMGITETTLSVQVSNINEFKTLVMESMKSRGKSEEEIFSVLSGLDRNQLEFVSGTESIQSILYSIVNSRVIKMKRRGEGSPQAAAHGWAKSTDDRLRGYRLSYRENGKDETPVIPAQVKLALPLDSTLIRYVNTKYGSLDGLNQAITALTNKLYIIEETANPDNLKLSKEEETLLKLTTYVGFRIPTQGLSSGDVLRVTEFLDPTYGSTIVTPEYITAKSGSDFDIDKLTLYSYHYDIIDGELVIKSTDEDASEEGIKRRFDAYLKENLPPAKFGYFLEGLREEVDNGTAKPKYAEALSVARLDEILDIYDQYIIEKDYKHKDAREYEEILEKIFVDLRPMFTEEFALLSESDFRKLNIPSQNSYEQLENKVLDLHLPLMLDPMRSRELMSPISDDNFKDAIFGVNWDIRLLAGTLQEKQNFVDAAVEYFKKRNNNANLSRADVTSIEQLYIAHRKAAITEWKARNEIGMNRSDIFSYDINVTKFQEFLDGKAGVAISALQNTFHVLSQRAGLKYNKEANMVLEHNQFVLEGKNSEGESVYLKSLDFSRITGTDKNRISDIISAYINAYVDVAKDPFVFDINCGTTTAGVMFTLIRSGVSMSDTVRFLNTPFVKEYTRTLKAAESLTYKRYLYNNEGNTAKKIRNVNKFLTSIYEQFANYNKGDSTYTDALKSAVYDFYNNSFTTYSNGYKATGSAPTTTKYGISSKVINESNIITILNSADLNLEKNGKELTELKAIDNLSEAIKTNLKIGGTNGYLNSDKLFHILMAYDNKNKTINMEYLKYALSELGLADHKTITDSQALLLYFKANLTLVDAYNRYQYIADELRTQVQSLHKINDILGCSNNIIKNEYKCSIINQKYSNAFTNSEKINNSTFLRTVNNTIHQMHSAIKSFSFIFNDKNQCSFHRFNKILNQLAIELPYIFSSPQKKNKLIQDLLYEFNTAIITNFATFASMGSNRQELRRDLSPSKVYNELLQLEGPNLKYIGKSGIKTTLPRYLMDIKQFSFETLSFSNDCQFYYNNKRRIDLFHKSLPNLTTELTIPHYRFYAKGEYNDNIKEVNNYNPSILTSLDVIDVKLNNKTSQELDILKSELETLRVEDSELFYDIYRLVLNQKGTSDKKIRSLFSLFNPNIMNSIIANIYISNNDELIADALEDFVTRFFLHHREYYQKYPNKEYIYTVFLPTQREQIQINQDFSMDPYSQFYEDNFLEYIKQSSAEKGGEAVKIANPFRQYAPNKPIGIPNAIYAYSFCDKVYNAIRQRLCKRNTINNNISFF